MSAPNHSSDNPPQNPVDSKGLTDLGPAQPENPPAPPQADADLRDPPSPAGVPRPDDR
ncbi:MULTISPECIES: hypothetical protein [unclassified Caballeronia]|uniref:hypothetical protein n=1 Tax=unclassified Caballeronia TaxID=2646786 RepID=UPI00158E86E8|nr:MULTISPECIES: hypothetical protein [unclassified Caballeronia]QSN62528.1 hypothetical protein JYK05_06585 [Caballeronia sp. M1242]